MCTLHFVKLLLYSGIVLCFTVIPSIKGNGCNEVLCGSIVSKCLLQQSCQCKLTDCFCCKDCVICMGVQFLECCGCLQMCPLHNDTFIALESLSKVGDLEGVPDLFETLTADENDDQWSTIRFPMRLSFQRHYNMKTKSFGLRTNDAVDQKAIRQKQPLNTVTCTVIYLNYCTTSNKCFQHCASMGSSSYRWFHNGCCECVGDNCYNYGINESRCTACPPDELDEVDEDEDDIDNADYLNENHDKKTWDYGENEIDYN